MREVMIMCASMAGMWLNSWRIERPWRDERAARRGGMYCMATQLVFVMAFIWAFLRSVL